MERVQMFGFMRVRDQSGSCQRCSRSNGFFVYCSGNDTT